MKRSGAEKVYGIRYFFNAGKNRGRVIIRSTSQRRAVAMARECGLYLTLNEIQDEGELTRDWIELAVAKEAGVWFREDLSRPDHPDKYKRMMPKPKHPVRPTEDEKGAMV